MVNTPFTNLHEMSATVSFDLFTFAEQTINFTSTACIFHLGKCRNSQIEKNYPKQNKDTMSCKNEGVFLQLVPNVFNVFGTL